MNFDRVGKCPRKKKEKMRLTKFTLQCKVRGETSVQPANNANRLIMKTRWFKPLGMFYLPVSAAGVVVTGLAALFCAQVFVAANRHAHSVSDMLYGIFPFFVCTFLLWDWVARKTSQPEE